MTDDVRANAECTPGTTRVEDINGRVVWRGDDYEAWVEERFQGWSATEKHYIAAALREAVEEALGSQPHRNWDYKRDAEYPDY